MHVWSTHIHTELHECHYQIQAGRLCLLHLIGPKSTVSCNTHAVLMDIQMQYRDLQMQYRDLQMQYRDLQMQYRDLHMQYRDLHMHYRDLHMHYRNTRLTFLCL